MSGNNVSASWSFVDNASLVLLFSTSSLEAWTNNQTMWGDATSTNGKNFTDGDPQAWYQDANGNWVQPDPNNPDNNVVEMASRKDYQDLETWLQATGDRSPTDPHYFMQWSQASIGVMESTLAQDKDHGKDFLGIVQSIGTEIGAEQQTESTKLSTESQASSSVVSNVNQAATPAANACDSVIGVVTSAAGSQQSISA